MDDDGDDVTRLHVHSLDGCKDIAKDWAIFASILATTSERFSSTVRISCSRYPIDFTFRPFLDDAVHTYNYACNACL